MTEPKPTDLSRCPMLATVSALLGIGAFGLVWAIGAWAFPVSVAAVICGHVVRHRMRGSEGQWIGWTASAAGCVFGYLRWMVEEGIMNVEFSFFAGPGLPAVQSKVPEEFTAANNAWCVVTDVTSATPPGMPVLFTRNLSITNLNQLTGPIRRTRSRRGPLGREYLAIVTKGGKAWVLPADDRRTWEDVFSDHAEWYGDHPVLRP